MAQNFIACDRDQELLSPPSLREWLPPDHLAWFVLDAVGAMDLWAFFARYREDGWGRAAHDPAMMVALLLYAYATGDRSSRRIERRCHEDVAVRVVAADQAPDTRRSAACVSATSSRWASCSATCSSCAPRRVGADQRDCSRRDQARHAAVQSNRRYEDIAREILAEAAQTDRLQDEQFGDRRGGELPAELSTAQGRRGWLREAKRRLDDRRAEEARPIPASRPTRLKQAMRRLDEELWPECQANAAYEAHRARGRVKDGRHFGKPPGRYRPPATPAGVINVVDPGFAQRQDLARLGAGLQRPSRRHRRADRDRRRSHDRFARLWAPRADVTAVEREFAGVGTSDTPEVVLADAGYWHHVQMERIINRGMQVLIPPDASERKTSRPGWDGGLYACIGCLPPTAASFTPNAGA